MEDRFLKRLAFCNLVSLLSDSKRRFFVDQQRDTEGHMYRVKEVLTICGRLSFTMSLTSSALRAELQAVKLCSEPAGKRVPESLHFFHFFVLFFFFGLRCALLCR